MILNKLFSPKTQLQARIVSEENSFVRDHEAFVILAGPEALIIRMCA